MEPPQGKEGRAIISGRTNITAILKITSSAMLAAVTSLCLVIPVAAVDLSIRALPTTTVHAIPSAGSAQAFPLPLSPPSPGEPCGGESDITCLSLGEGGVFEKDVNARSTDRMAEVDIIEGTRALTVEGVPPTWIMVEPTETPSSPPSNHVSVTSTYNFEPQDTTFDNPIVVTLRYFDKDVPDGVREDRLVLVAWSSFMREWVKLDSVVDTINNLISAEPTRLTPLAVIAATAPASFRLSRLTIVPEEVGLEELAVVSVLVENTGDLTDVLHVEFRKNGIIFDSKDVTLEGHRGITVSSEVASDKLGKCTVSINELATNFTVNEPVAAPLPAAQANIQFSGMQITPETAEVGQAITVGIVAINHGDIEGSRSVSLLIDGRFADGELITVAPGVRQVITFVITEHVAGVYSAVVEGWGATFTVDDVVETQGFNWGILGWTVGGFVAVAAVLVYFFWWRRREFITETSIS